jgi:hypothetical protein
LFSTLPGTAAVATLIRRCRWSRSRTFSEDTEVFRLPHKKKSKKLKSGDLCGHSYGYLLIQWSGNCWSSSLHIDPAWTCSIMWVQLNGTATRGAMSLLP